MKIAIHETNCFSPRWIKYCKENSIPFKIVNCYDNDIIHQISDCDAFMWDHHQADIKDVLFAKQLLYSLEQAGKKVFPNFYTNWHFDDKVGQKYLFESVGAPLVPSYVFYTRKEALKWVEVTSFPKIFKLRGGAGSANVKMVTNKKHAKKLVNKAFDKGFSQYDRWEDFRERIRKYLAHKSNFLNVFKGIGRLFINKEFAKNYHREKGYIYFQDLIPNNKFDIRVIVIGDKAFAIKRLVRKNDFRASGSGLIEYKRENFDSKTLSIAFDLTDKLQMQCAAFDFVYDKGNTPLILEVSYGFASYGYDPCPGYWDRELKWHEGIFNSHGWIIENLISKNQLKK